MLFWKVTEAPTGPFRSFHRRGWPLAYVKRDQARVVAHVLCPDDYTPARMRDGAHAPLRVQVALKMATETNWQWRMLKGEFKTLVDAKAAAQAFYDKNPALFT